jgi:L-threonylcarbamoyladenylate synthase
MGNLILSCTDRAIKEGAKLLREGKVVIYPTDTLYGVGCNALDEEAIKRVFKLKKRDSNKPLSIALCDLKMLRRYASFDDKAMKVMEKFFPGPVTFILRKKGLPDILTGGSEKVGVRIPEDRTALKLIMEAEVPIVTTSANVTGRASAKTAEKALEELPDADLALDGGKRSGLPSTIIDLTCHPPEILREGGKSASEVRSVLDEIYEL